MKITRTSPYSGKDNTLEIDVTEEQIIKWQQGMLIQDAMPNLSPDEREFMMTGCTPEDWEDMFGDDWDEDDVGDWDEEVTF